MRIIPHHPSPLTPHPSRKATTMMTMTDVARYATDKPERQYSPNRNQAAYELSLLGRTDRATRIEKFIAREIEFKTGYNCNLTQPNWEWDITVALESKPVRIEVKSALHATTNPNTYNVQNIKPDNFDYLFIVLVTPDGTVERWAKADDVRKHCKGRTRHCNGFSISIYASKIDDIEWLHRIEDFPL